MKVVENGAANQKAIDKFLKKQKIAAPAAPEGLGVGAKAKAKFTPSLR